MTTSSLGMSSSASVRILLLLMGLALGVVAIGLWQQPSGQPDNPALGAEEAPELIAESVPVGSLRTEVPAPLSGESGTANANPSTEHEANSTAETDGTPPPILRLPVALETGALRDGETLMVFTASSSTLPAMFPARLHGLPQVSVVGGRIEMPIDPPRSSRAVLYKFEHYSTKQSGAIVLELPVPGDCRHPLLVLKPPIPVLSGSVVDEDSGAPISSATMWLTSYGPDSVRSSAKSDKSGRFVLCGDFREGAHRLQVTHHRYQAITLEIQIPADRELVIPLGRGASVRGRVLLDDPSFVRFLYVQTTDADGDESSSELFGAAFELPGYSPDGDGVDVAVVIQVLDQVVANVINWIPSDSDEVVFDLRGKLLEIDQEVVGPDGASLSGTFVEVRGSFGASGQLSVAKDGRIRSLVPKDTEWLTARRRGGEATMIPLASVAGPVRLR